MADAIWYGFNMPFIGGVQKVLSRQVDERLIKNDLLQLLLTVPGERIYRPNFGTKLRSIVFDNLNDNDMIGLAQDIKTAIVDFEKRVKVNGVACTLSDDGQSVAVRIDVSMSNQSLNRYVIDLSFNQDGSITVTK